MTLQSSKVKDLAARLPVELTDLLYLVDALAAADSGNYKSTVANLFAALGIFYVQSGVPDVSLGQVGNYAFRGDGASGSYLYHKVSTGGLSIRRQAPRYLAHTNRHIFVWGTLPGSGGALIESWTPIL